MLQYSFMRVSDEVVRPIIPVIFEGPRERNIQDGLLDTGADRTILPERQARRLGVTLPAEPDGIARAAGGGALEYRLAEVTIELRAAGQIVRWKASVGFTEQPIAITHLGYRGFPEFFHSTFQGPEEMILLEPTAGIADRENVTPQGPSPAR